MLMMTRSFTQISRECRVANGPVAGRSLHHSGYLRIVTCTLVLAVSCADAATGSSETKDCRLKQYASVDLEIGDEVSVPVLVNGRSARMQLDLAWSVTRVWRSALADLGMRAHHFHSDVKIDGGAINQSAAFKSLVIGALDLGKGSFVVAPLPEKRGTSTLPELTVGALGMDVFGHVDFELDLAHAKLNLFSQDHCPGAVVYWSRTFASAPLYRGTIGNLYVIMEADGRAIESTFSPNDPWTLLTLDAASRLYGRDSVSPGTPVDADGAFQVNSERLMQLSIPGLTIKDAKVILAPPIDCRLLATGGTADAAAYVHQCMGVYPMQLGRNVLQKLRLYFATGENVLYFTAADSSPARRQ